MRPDSATEPASASPMPSRIERLPRCVTSAGTAAARARVMKSATYAVSDSSLRSDMPDLPPFMEPRSYHKRATLAKAPRARSADIAGELGKGENERGHERDEEEHGDERQDERHELAYDLLHRGSGQAAQDKEEHSVRRGEQADHHVQNDDHAEVDQVHAESLGDGQKKRDQHKEQRRGVEQATE